MHLKLNPAWVWISTGLICPPMFLALGTGDPYPGESIAAYLEMDIVNTTDNAKTVIDSPANANGSTECNDTAQIIGRDSGPVPWKPAPHPSLYFLQHKLSHKTLSAVYNGSDARGYNITLPDCTHADEVVGDWKSPSGDLIENCTLAQMSQRLRLPSPLLLSLISSRAETLLAKINNILHGSTCEPPLVAPDRELRANPRPGFRFDPAMQTGYWSSLILIGGGTFGLGFTGLHLGIIHEGITANITLTTEVSILAVFASVGTLLTIITERERKYIGYAEAFVLNVFLFAGEKIYDNLEAGFKCLQETPLIRGLQSISQSLTQKAQILVADSPQNLAMRDAGVSSVNLVSTGDVESQLQNGQCAN